MKNNINKKIISLLLLIISVIFLISGCSCTKEKEIVNILSITLSNNTFYTNDSIADVVSNIEKITCSLENDEIKDFLVTENDCQIYFNETILSLDKQLSLDMTNLKLVYKNKQYNFSIIVKCFHTGGTADCTHKAICSNCNNEYGDYQHSYYILDYVPSSPNKKGYTIYQCEHCPNQKFVYDN